MIASDLSDGLLGTAAVLTALGFLWMIIVHGGRLKNLSADVHGVKGLVNLFGIESPGLTSSLAIGEAVVRALQ